MEKIIIAESLLIVLVCGVSLFMGCKTFKPVMIEDQPDECNDFYTVMAYYVKAGKVDSAFVGTVYTECKNARAEKRKEVREKHCKELIFGADNLDKTDYKRYSQYQECIK